MSTTSNVAGAIRTDLNQTTPFILHGSDVSGRLVRLHSVVDQILAAHPYPNVVRHHLGQIVGLAAAMAAAMKFDGQIIIQAKGDGAVPLLVANASSDGGVRGYAQWDDEKLAAYDDPMQVPVPTLLGHGYIAFTIDQGKHTDRYQGIVPLMGDTIADCMQYYFDQSDQLDMVVKLASREREDGLGMVVGAMLVQRLPDIGGEASKADYDEEAAAEAWRKALAFVGSLKADELANEALGEEALLFRLFHEDGVRVFDTKPIEKTCGCSEERIRAVLSSMSGDDFEYCFVEQSDGRRVAVSTCEFCGSTYEFERESFTKSAEGDLVGEV